MTKLNIFTDDNGIFHGYTCVTFATMQRTFACVGRGRAGTEEVASKSPARPVTAGYGGKHNFTKQRLLSEVRQLHVFS